MKDRKNKVDSKTYIRCSADNEAPWAELTADLLIHLNYQSFRLTLLEARIRSPADETGLFAMPGLAKAMLGQMLMRP